MKEYKVIALSVGTLHGVKDAGAIVTEQDFPEGHADELVKKDFLKPIKSKTKKAPVEAAPVEAAPVEAAPVEAAPVENTKKSTAKKGK